MHPTTQPHQRGYRQDGWPSTSPYASAVPSHSSAQVGTNFTPLPPSAPSLPPPRPAYMQPPMPPRSPGLPAEPLSPRPPPSPRPQSFDVHVPPSLRPHQIHPQPAANIMQNAPAGRLVNPHELREQERMSSGPTAFPNPHRDDTTIPNPHRNDATLPNPHRNEATRLSFGPGDPLFSAHQASAAYSSEQAPRPSPSPRPYSVNAPPQSQISSPQQPPRLTQRTPSNSSARLAASGRPPSQNASAPAHGAPGHATDNCPGCQAEMDDTIKASLQSAQQEDAKRVHEQHEQEELQRIYAANAEENERQRRLAEEDEQLLQKAMEDSRREAEEEAQRRAQHEEILLEESRQHALRQREEEARREAEMLEAAKLASASQEQQRRQDLDAMREAEERAIQLSLQEQEEEWARRESAERSLLEFLDQRNSISRSTTPLSAVGNSASASTSQSPAQLASTSKGAADHPHGADLEAEYWRFAGHDEAYRLALEMQRASLAEATSQNRQGTSTPLARRPLPRTPEMPEHNEEAGPSLVGHKLKQEHAPAVSQPAKLYDEAEDAPPAYVEAAQPGPSSSSAQGGSTNRPPEKPSSSRYDTVTLAALNRPVLQNRSSSSSSAHSRSQGSITTDSPRPSFGGASSQSDAPQTPPGSNEPFSNPHSASASPSIPQRNSSYFVPDSKRSSVSASSLGSEHKGQRAIAGVDFGYSNLPFAPKLDKSSLPGSQSASSIPSGSSTSGSASATVSKFLFPTTIELSSVTKVSSGSNELSGGGFFVIRAPSWKGLLRAIAWYGNSRVEATPELVAAASDRRSRCVLRAEVEFVTPTRVDMGYGVGEHARVAQTTGSVPKNPSPAHVSLCLSLLPISPTRSSASADASAWLKSPEYAIIRRESRRLDAWYAGKGSTRRLIQLARQPPALPAALIQIAQLLHASHTFSAACPSSSSTARHSPRDLHHAIERHDQGFVAKQKALLAASSALTNPTNPRMSMQSTRTTDDDDEDEEDDEVDFTDFSLLADGSFDAQDKVLMGKRQRLKAKVKRRLAKRNGDGRVVDEDLAAWITPFHVSEHG